MKNVFRLVLMLVFLTIVNKFDVYSFDAKDLSIGSVSYLSYNAKLTKDGLENNNFSVNRSYLTVKKSIYKHLSFRFTLDAHQDETGDMKARLKYVYAHYLFEDVGFITKPNIEFGLVHTPWLDFEQYINYYRMQGKMFMERSGLFNSADFGITVGGYFGGEMDDKYKKNVNKKYPGRYGSFAIGVYNGGGYHANENTENKVLQGRLTIRPLPDIIPGMQLSYFGVIGKGNKDYGVDSIPDWQVNTGMLSYENKYFTLAGQFTMGKGNQKGTFVVDSETNVTPETDYTASEFEGYSVFAEVKLDKNWRIIGRYDNFNKNKENTDNSEQRIISGLGYDFGNRNILILDYEKTMYELSGKDDIDLLKLTMQIKF